MNETSQPGSRRDTIVGTAVILIAVALMLSFCVGIGAETKAPQHASEPDVIAQAPAAADSPPEDVWAERRAEVEAAPGLGITPDQYAKRFNANMQKVDLPFRIAPDVESSGMAADTFQSVLNDHLALTGGVKPESGEMNGILFVGQGDGSQASGARLLLAAAVALASVQDAVSLGDMMSLVLDLVEDGQAAKGETITRTLNNIKYSLVISDYIGATFSVEPL